MRPIHATPCPWSGHCSMPPTTRGTESPGFCSSHFRRTTFEATASTVSGETGGCLYHRRVGDEDRFRLHVHRDTVRLERRDQCVDGHAQVASEQPRIQPHEHGTMAIR